MKNEKQTIYELPVCITIEENVDEVILASSKKIEAGGENGDGEYD